MPTPSLLTAPIQVETPSPRPVPPHAHSQPCDLGEGERTGRRQEVGDSGEG